MKSRIGFVSNSSSSSYILPHADMDDIAKAMVETIIEHREGNRKPSNKDIREAKTFRRKLKEALSHPRVESGEIGIRFSSCNFDTYIFISGGKMYIATSRNYDWGDIFFDGVYVETECQGPEDGYALVYDGVACHLFYNVETGRIHYGVDWGDHVSVDHKCPNCRNNMGYYVIDEDKNKLCSWCFDGILEPVNEAKKD